MPAPALIASSVETVGLGTSGFLRDLALIMCVAAGTTLLFQRLRQPVVLGYLLAGFLLGPHLFVDLIEGPGTLEFLSQLGVVLLMYSLGLEFRLRKLRALGPSAGFVALFEVCLMFWLGFSAARLLGWSAREALFSGGILAISSTTLVRKLFGEQAVERGTRELVLGVLVFEDLVAILLLAGLTAVATGAELELAVVARAAGRLALFVGLVLVGGLAFVPRLVRATVALGRRETLLVTSLGVCFALALVALRSGYSIALGAFLAGSLVAESGHGERIEKLIEPVRDLFAALFFVSVGMLIDPGPLRENWRAGLLLAGLVIGGKVIGVSLGAFLAGRDTRSALRAGLCMAQVGEFSFIIAGLGVASGATREILYPLAVAISTLTAFVSPILIRHAESIADLIDRSLPGSFTTFARRYAGWVRSIQRQGSRNTRWGIVRHAALLVLLDAGVISALVIGGALAHAQLDSLLKDRLALAPLLVQSVVILAVASLCVLPLLGMVRGARRLGRALASMARPPGQRGRSAGEAEEHVRAGAHVLVEILGQSARRAPVELDDLGCLLPSRGVMVQVRVPAGHAAAGRTLAALGLSSQAGLTVLAITRGEKRLVLPGGNRAVEEGDELALNGSPAQLERALGLLGLRPESRDSAVARE